MGRQLIGGLFLSAGFLFLSAVSLIRGEWIGAATGAIGLAWGLSVLPLVQAEDVVMDLWDHSRGLLVPRRRSPVLMRSLAIAIAGSLIFAACPGVCLASDPASSVSFEGPQAQAEFSSKASNGYSIFFEIDRGKASLTAHSDEGTVIYEGEGSLVDGRIHFGLGKLGRINVRFKPDGSVDYLRPPKSCRGREQAVRSGAFVGSIKFRGESGYTRLNARRVFGTVASPRSWKCPDTPVRFPGSAADLPVALGAFAPHGHVVFVAIGRPEVLPLRFFAAGTSERQGALRVKRSVLVEGKPVSFDFSGNLGSARVSPPKPFAGTASFKRNADGSTEWLGTLSVALPGVGSIALTGPAFTAKLEWLRSVQEFSELLGLS